MCVLACFGLCSYVTCQIRNTKREVWPSGVAGGEAYEDTRMSDVCPDQTPSHSRSGSHAAGLVLLCPLPHPLVQL